MDIRSRRREQGSALFVAILMLVLMGFLGIAALDTVSRDREVAGVQNRARSAFYAAEAGVASARQIIRDQIGDESDPLPAFPTQGAPSLIGDAGLYDREMGLLPQFYGDPNPSAPDPCAGGPYCYWKPGPTIKEGENASQSKGAKAIWKLWRINVMGQSPDGAAIRIEAVEAKRGTVAGGPGSEY